MRLGMTFALTCAVGCGGASQPHLVDADAMRDVDALVASRPLAPGANLRNDEIERTGAVSVHVVQVRGGELPHRHAQHDLVVTVVRGEGVLHVADAERPMHAGDVAVVPRGVAHWYRNRGGAPSVAIAVFAPPLTAPDNVPVAEIDSPGRPR